MLWTRPFIWGSAPCSGSFDAGVCGWPGIPFCAKGALRMLRAQRIIPSVMPERILNTVRIASSLLLRVLPFLWFLACGEDEEAAQAIGVGNAGGPVPVDVAMDASNDSGAPLDAGAQVEDASVPSMSTGGNLIDTKINFPDLGDAAILVASDAGRPGDSGVGPLTAVDADGCLEGGVRVSAEVAGDGSCETPFHMDLTDVQIGDVLEFRDIPALGDAPVMGVQKCGASTTRDIVIAVTVRPDVDVEISVDADPNVDSVLLASSSIPDNCGVSQAEQCVDIQGLGGCEYIRLRAGVGLKSGNAWLYVSEALATTRPLTVRFRVQDPGSGL